MLLVLQQAKQGIKVKMSVLGSWTGEVKLYIDVSVYVLVGASSNAGLGGFGRQPDNQMPQPPQHTASSCIDGQCASQQGLESVFPVVVPFAFDLFIMLSACQPACLQWFGPR